MVFIDPEKSFKAYHAHNTLRERVGNKQSSIETPSSSNQATEKEETSQPTNQPTNMDELLKLAGQSGMNPQQAQATTGGLLNFIQGHMDSNKFDQQVAQNLPGAQQVMQQQQQATSGGGAAAATGGMGGLLGSAMSAFDSSSGSQGSGGDGKTSGGLAALLATLMGQGVDPKMVQAFLPVFAAYIKSQCGIDVSTMLGMPATTTTTTGAGQATSGGGLPGNLGGLASKFGFGK